MKSGPEYHKLWDDFLSTWPLDRLKAMTIDEYCKAGNIESFIHWIEFRLSDMGSIAGGSAFKFGIFNRKSDQPTVDGGGRRYTKDFGWYAKYGDSPQEAFSRVRDLVFQTAAAAREGDLSRIDEIDLGDTYKWKIAFHYQRREDPLVTPIFSLVHLRAALGQQGAGIDRYSELYRALHIRRQGQDVLAYGAALWDSTEKELTAGNPTVEQAERYLSERFGADVSPTQKMSAFITANGRHLALRKERKEVRLFLDPDVPAIPGVGIEKRYDRETPRSSNLSSKVPSLAVGNPAVLVSVKSMGALERLCDAYEGSKAESRRPEDRTTEKPQMNAQSQPLNQILYGPPGTGKTYKSVEKALAILDPEFVSRNASNRVALRKRFDEFAVAGRVQFVTFHQSFSYEDFVEGIRVVESGETELNKSQPAFAVEAGVFRRIAEAALLARQGGQGSGVAPDARVWKISIDGSGASHVRDECFRRGEMRIGWPQVGDLSNADRDKAELDAFSQESWTNQNSLTAFAEEVAIGDIVLCLKSQTSIQAVGVVTGDYRFQPSTDPVWRNEFVHVRSVQWLKTGIDANIIALNSGVRLTLKTVYPLPRIAAADALALVDQRPGKDAIPPPYVLIIDEINRGNISRIFGELITLVEDTKRLGHAEATSTILPYSRKSFSVPDNLFIIGTMNTADRSLTGLDIALRRRFRFEEMAPDESELSDLTVQGVPIDDLLASMNERIEVLLDRDHRIGHTYFLPLGESPTLDKLSMIFENSIIPLLREYFYGDWERIHWVLNDHRKPMEARFIVKPSESTAALFGQEVAERIDDRRWTLNRAAFSNIESYWLIAQP